MDKITITNGHLNVPFTPDIPFIEGDGIGADIWRVSKRVIDAAVSKAFAGQRSIRWQEVYAGEKSQKLFNNWLPEETLAAFKENPVGIKGPLATPVGEGKRSVNVALRRELDLYACVRPVRWLKRTPSPVRRPELVDMVIFRENTEDLYSGIEFQEGTEENQQFKDLLQTHFPQQYARIRFPESSSIGLKPISREGSKRLVRAAIRYALTHNRKSVSLVHKGNIMKFTEGGFRKWGYEVSKEEFGDQVFTWLEWEAVKQRDGREAADAAMETALQNGKLLIKDIITDAAFETALTRPAELDVLATTNLNGDYLSDALAAQVGGLGLAPGANINYESGAAIFEATHGTAPQLAGLDKANPSSLLLSACMMLEYLGWLEAANLITHSIETTIQKGTVTFDLAALTPDAVTLSTSEFGDALIKNLE